MLDQVEDGSYYGKILPTETEITNYVLSFQSNAFSTSDANNVKSMSGDANLELLRLRNSTASLKIIGGQILVEDTTTGELQNVYDIALTKQSKF